MITQNNFDMFANSGRCESCTDTKPLDSMVRLEYVKGKYHCVDCETTKFNDDYDFFVSGKLNLTPLRKNMIHKLIGWCFG